MIAICQIASVSVVPICMSFPKFNGDKTHISPSKISIIYFSKQFYVGL